MPLAITYRTPDGRVLAEATQPADYRDVLFTACRERARVVLEGHLVEVRWLHLGRPDHAGVVAVTVQVLHQGSCPCACE